MSEVGEDLSWWGRRCVEERWKGQRRQRVGGGAARGTEGVERRGLDSARCQVPCSLPPPLALFGSGGGLAPVPGLANKANPARASPVGAAQGHATGPPATSWSDSGKDRTHASARTSPVGAALGYATETWA